MFQRMIVRKPKTVVYNQRGVGEWPVKVMDGDWSAQTMPEPQNPADEYAPSQRGLGLGAGPGTAPNTWFDNLTERIFGAKGFDPQRNPTTTAWGENAGSMMNVGGPVPPLQPAGPSKRKMVADATPPVAFGSTPLHRAWTAPMGPMGKDASTSWANKQAAANYTQDPWSDRFGNHWEPDHGLEARRAPAGAGQEVPPLAPFSTGNTNGPLPLGDWSATRQRDATMDGARPMDSRPHGMMDTLPETLPDASGLTQRDVPLLDTRSMDSRPHGMMDTLPDVLPDTTALTQRDTEGMEVGNATFTSMPTGMSHLSKDGDDAHKFAHKTVLGAVTYDAGGGVGAVPPDPLAHPKNSKNVMMEQPRADTAEMRQTRGDIGVSMTNNRNTWGAPRQSRRVKDEEDDWDKDHTRAKWEIDSARNKRQRSRSF
jgi:hypothetical protein